MSLRRRPTAALALITALALALPPATAPAAGDGPPVSTAKKAKKKKKKKCRRGYVLKKLKVKVKGKKGKGRKRRTRRACRKRAAPKRIVPPGPGPTPVLNPTPAPQTDWAAILTQSNGLWFQTWNSADPLCYLHRFSQSGALRTYSRTTYTALGSGCATGLGIPGATGTWTVSGNTLTLSFNGGITTESHRLDGYDAAFNRISRTRLPPGAGSAPWCGGGVLSCPP